MRTDTPEYGWLELVPKDGGTILGVCQFNPQYGNAVKPGDNAIVTFTVDDIVAVKALFEKQGVTMLGDIIEVPGHIKMLFFTDLDGNKFQICQTFDQVEKKSCC